MTFGQFDKLEIDTNGRSPDEIIAEFEDNLNSHWDRSLEREERLNSEQYCFIFRDPGSNFEATLWLSKKSDSDILYVTNVVPTKTSQISADRYNDLLQKFKDEIVDPALDEMSLSSATQSSPQSLMNSLSNREMEKLRKFSDAANKAAGGTHPSDRDRWREFVAEVHSNGTNVDRGALAGWLEGEGWSEEDAQKLSDEFYEATELLEKYDEVT